MTRLILIPDEKTKIPPFRSSHLPGSFWSILVAPSFEFGSELLTQDTSVVQSVGIRGAIHSQMDCMDGIMASCLKPVCQKRGKGHVDEEFHRANLMVSSSAI
jgi:hypothetical protein